MFKEKDVFLLFEAFLPWLSGGFCLRVKEVL